MKAGDVVVLDFPFTDLSGSKARPAMIVAEVGKDDYIAAQITTNAIDPLSVRLESSSFVAGGLRVISFVRPGKLFTAHRSLVAKTVGRLTDAARVQVKDAVIEVIRRG